jgi:hypothetical protein
MVRFLTQLRGNDSLKKQRALQVLVGGILLAVVGAWLA